MVRFATTCDMEDCHERSEEYTAFPSCRECGEDVCLRHAVPGTLITGDGDGPDTVICAQCADGLEGE